MTVTTKPGRWESTKDTVKTIAQGRPDVSANLWLLPLCFLLHRGLRVRQAPGFPCALCSREGGMLMAKLARGRGEIAEVRLKFLL